MWFWTSELCFWWNSNKKVWKSSEISQRPKTFSFCEIETDSLKKMTDKLDSRKSGTFRGIPVNCQVKGVWDISATFLPTIWNDEVHKDLKFSNELWN